MRKMCAFIVAKREAYSVEDVIDKTMTVGELKQILSEYDDDTPIVTTTDSENMYGAITEYSIGDNDHCI